MRLKHPMSSLSWLAFKLVFSSSHTHRKLPLKFLTLLGSRNAALRADVLPYFPCCSVRFNVAPLRSVLPYWLLYCIIHHFFTPITCLRLCSLFYSLIHFLAVLFTPHYSGHIFAALSPSASPAHSYAFRLCPTLLVHLHTALTVSLLKINDSFQLHAWRLVPGTF